MTPLRSSEVMGMGFGFSSLDELGDGPGFRKVRRALDVSAFGVNGVVFAPGYEGFLHYHDAQDELYFVHRGTARFEVDGEERLLGPGALVHGERCKRQAVLPAELHRSRTRRPGRRPLRESGQLQRGAGQALVALV